MSNKKQETIADIVREMRQRFEPYAKSDNNDARYIAYLGYAEFADRIEAAANRSADNLERAWRMFRRCNPNVYFDVPGRFRFIDWLFAEAKGE